MAQPDPGKIRKVKGGFEVTVRAPEEPEKLEGVVCKNPRAPISQREYIKVFRNKRIYLPDQYDRAIREVLQGKNVLRLGFNGYSTIREDRAKRWGVTIDRYDAACAKLAFDVIQYLQGEFPGVDIRLVNGASDMGIDRSTNRVASELNIPILGFSCPNYMVHVKDDDAPVHVARDKDTYSDKFVESLDVLIAANGAETAYKHDMRAVLTYFKHFIPVDVVSAISTTGGVPALGPDGKVENAVKAYGYLVHIMGQGMVAKGFDRIADFTKRECRDVCRQQLEPSFAFPRRSV